MVILHPFAMAIKTKKITDASVGMPKPLLTAPLKYPYSALIL